jgi:hypothetical protein
VGSHTWAALTASPRKPSSESPIATLSTTAIEQIVKLARESELARINWADRGTAPPGYIKGMAVTFGHVYAKLKAGDSTACVMAAMSSGNGDVDALAWYDSEFQAAGMSNSVTGVATLRHLFVLLLGLGMRESSGRYCEGRDMHADNVDADTAEAGLFQMSWNARAASSELPRLFAAYSAKPDGFLSIFQEGVTPKPSDLQNFGTGEGVAFQRLCKSCPAFAVEAAGVGLRVLRKHWGPINQHHAEVRAEADRLFEQVQKVVDLPGAVSHAPVEGREAHSVLEALRELFERLAKDRGTTMQTPADNPIALLEKVAEVVRSLGLRSKSDGAAPTGDNPIALIEQAAKLLLSLDSQGKQEGTASTDQQIEHLRKIIALIMPLINPAAVTDKAAVIDKSVPLGPVNGALGETIGKLLNGKKTAIGAIGGLLTSLMSTPLFADGIGKAVVALAPGLSQFALPIFLALTGWGVLGKLEKWAQGLAAVNLAKK